MTTIMETGIIPSPSPRNLIPVSACPHPFLAARQDFQLPEGLTVAEMIHVVQPDEALRLFGHVFIDDRYIAPDEWALVKPEYGQIVSIRIIPSGGGGNKDILRTVLQIAVTLGSAILPPPFNVIAAVGGNLLITALIPPAKPKLRTADATIGQSFTISGGRNAFNPFGVVPRVFGKVRMVPPYAATPVIEARGFSTYFRQLFIWGYGPLEISDIKIGETAITDFDDVEVETIEGNPGDVITLFPSDISQDTFATSLKKSDDWVQRTTAAGIDEIGVDIYFPVGLFNVNSGSPRATRVQVEIEYSPTGDSSIFYSNGRFEKTSAGNKTLTTNTVDGHTHTLTIFGSGGGDACRILNGSALRITSTNGGVVWTNETNGHRHAFILDVGVTGGQIKFKNSTNQFVGANASSNHIDVDYQPSKHTHDVTIAAHSHTIDDHTHGVDYGIFEETNSPSITVFRDNGAGYGSSIGPYTTDQRDLVLTSDYTSSGWKKLKFVTTARCRIAAQLELKLDITA